MAGQRPGEGAGMDEGPVMVVTGAAGGLGAAVVARLAADGARVWAADLPGDRAPVAASPEITSVGLDVTDAGAQDRLAETVLGRAGRLDGWVNAAGVMAEHRTVDLDPSGLARVMDVNFGGVVGGSLAAARAMRRLIEAGITTGGSIVNLVSAIIDSPQPRLAAYGASKAAASHFSRTLAIEEGKRGIRVNLIAPGWTRTAMTEATFADPDGAVDEQAVADHAATMARFTPLRRAAEPEDTAAAVAWLLGPEAGFVTGQTLRPHGGATLPW